MLLPGPEAQQLATYIGWLLHGTRGGVVAGSLFVLPGFLSILLLSYLYVAFADVSAVEGLLFGLKAAVLAVVLQALVRIGSRAIRSRAMLVVAGAAFMAMFLFAAPFPLVVILAGIVGYVGGRLQIPAFSVGIGHAGSAAGLSDAESALGEGLPAHARPTVGWSISMSLVLLVLWLAPVLGLVLLLGPDSVFSQIATFFSKMAVVTFGGAYAVLGYVAQEAVQGYGWLRPEEMLDGLGMAETTPGPLIQVVQFVGFIGAFRNPGGLDPLVAATFASVLTTWVTFVPCFLWIFLGAPYIERLRGNVALTGALSAITAAVVGVVLNLAIWFAMHALFRGVREVHTAGLNLDVPVWSTLDPASAVLTAIAAIAVFYLKLGIIPVIGACSVLGAAYYLLTGG
jgi:chromate transporter